MERNNLRSCLRYVCCYFLCVAGLAHGTEPKIQDGYETWEIYTTKDGLVQSTVTAITQDNLGFMWFGTQNGLSRFDGEKFLNFQPNPDETGGLSAEYVIYLFPDREGRLWVSSYTGGVDYYDSQTGRFIHQPIGENDSARQGAGFVTSILQTEDGRIWFSSGMGLHVLDPESGDTRSYRHDAQDPKSLSSDFIWNMHVDGRFLWLGTNLAGLNKLNRETGEVQRFAHVENDPTTISHVAIQSLKPGPEGKLWLGTYEGLDLFNPHSGLVERTLRRQGGYLLGDQLGVLLVDRQDNLWVGSRKGLTRINATQDEVTHYTHDPINPHSLSNNFVASLYESRDGMIWVGTYSGGVCKFNTRKNRFNHIRPLPSRESWLSGGGVWSAYEDHDGSLWLGTFDDGISHLKPDTMTFQHYPHDPDDPATLSDARVYVVMRDREDTLWVGTTNGLDKLTEQGFLHYRNDLEDETTLSHNAVYSLLEDNKGRFWVGTYGFGLNLMDRKQGSFHRYIANADEPNALGHNLVLDLFEDSDQRLYVAGDLGIDLYVEQEDHFRHFRQEEGKPHSISHNAIQGFFEDEAHNLWIATYGGGLNRWRLEDRRANRNRFKHYNTQMGFPDNVITGLIQDASGILWVGTPLGLVRFDVATESWKLIEAQEGLQGSDFSFSSFLRLRDDRLLMGGAGGINMFRPTELEDMPQNLPLRITSFQLFGKEAATETPPWYMKEVTLGYKDKVAAFEIAGLNYHRPKAHQYRYKLPDLSKDWIELGQSNTVNLTNLPPGRHLLEMAAADSEGNWHPSKKLTLTVLPPPWRTWWAFLLYACTLLGVFLWMVRARTRKLQRRKTILEGLVEKRTRALHQAQEELVNAAHQAGKAEVATHVLHNVGNILNNISTSTQLLRETLEKTPHVRGLEHIVQLMEEAEGLERFIQTEKGKRTPDALKRLGVVGRKFLARLEEETQRLEQEVRKATALVKSQSDLADTGHFVTGLELSSFLEKLILEWNGKPPVPDVLLVGEHHPLPPAQLDKLKLDKCLHILLHWISIQLADGPDKVINIRSQQAMDGQARLEVGAVLPMRLRGVGNELFSQNFGKEDGNLHNLACAISEMHGTISVIDGRRTGATVFLFHLPITQSSKR